MSHLLDVNLLIACAWSGHPDHARANRWLNSARQFATCPASQMGFLRVSMSPAYGAAFADARTALDAITRVRAHRFITDATTAAALPAITSSKDVSDAHLVRLAAAHNLKLATLDAQLLAKAWASGIAENPL